MGCNCKKTANAAKKYTNEDTVDNLTGVKKLLFFIKKILTVVLVIIVFIIGTPFLIINGVKRILTKKSLRINLTNIIKLFNVRSK